MEAGTKILQVLLNNITFDTAFNFNQVDLPYPVWNCVKSSSYSGRQKYNPFCKEVCTFAAKYLRTQAW